MTELIKTLCSLDAVSGDEKAVRDFITNQIDVCCDWHIDNLGNIILFKKANLTHFTIIYHIFSKGAAKKKAGV